MIFNRLKKVLSNHHFFFRGEEIEITNIYTYLGVQVLKASFQFEACPSACVNKGYRSLALLERQCF
jgi:hypothetical protein